MNDPQPARPLALKSRLLWLLWVPLLVGLDQWTKQIAFQKLEHLEFEEPIRLLADTIRLTFARNPGAFASLGAGLTETQRVWVLIIPNLILLPGVLLWMLLHKDITRFQYAALGLILAGGIGNIIDRLRLGYVVDFLNVGIGENLRTHVFNVADMYITFAVVLLGWLIVRGAPDKTHASPQREQGPA